jgi:hypothetical protein
MKKVGRDENQLFPFGPTVAGAVAFGVALFIGQFNGVVFTTTSWQYLSPSFWLKFLGGSSSVPVICYGLSCIGVVLVAATVYFIVDLVGSNFSAGMVSIRPGWWELFTNLLLAVLDMAAKNRQKWKIIVEKNERVLKQCIADDQRTAEVVIFVDINGYFKLIKMIELLPGHQGQGRCCRTGRSKSDNLLHMSVTM